MGEPSAALTTPISGASARDDAPDEQQRRQRARGAAGRGDLVEALGRVVDGAKARAVGLHDPTVATTPRRSSPLAAVAREVPRADQHRAARMKLATSCTPVTFRRS